MLFARSLLQQRQQPGLKKGCRLYHRPRLLRLKPSAGLVMLLPGGLLVVDQHYEMSNLCMAICPCHVGQHKLHSP